MGRYRSVEHQREQLGELQGIIASMKTLSQLELHKLGGLSEGHHAMEMMLERVVADFLHFYPRPRPLQDRPLWLLLGSERGFCGDFNDALIRRLLQACPGCRERPQQVLAVGRKLWLRLEEELPGIIPLPGASVSEELPQALAQVVDGSREQLAGQQADSLHLLSHSGEQGAVTSCQLLPPAATADFPLPTTPPLLQLTPDEFFAAFLQHYLYLGLTEAFTLPLLAENHLRVRTWKGRCAGSMSGWRCSAAAPVPCVRRRSPRRSRPSFSVVVKGEADRAGRARRNLAPTGRPMG